jgi:hypothetical protein
MLTHLSVADVFVVMHQKMAKTARKNPTRKTMASLHIPDEHCPEVAIGRLVSSGSVAMHEQLWRFCETRNETFTLWQRLRMFISNDFTTTKGSHQVIWQSVTNCIIWVLAMFISSVDGIKEARWNLNDNANCTLKRRKNNGMTYNYVGSLCTTLRSTIS